MTDNPSPDTLVDPPIDSGANGGGTVEIPALKLDEMNKFLGTDFKDVPTALQAIKETRSFVGKRKEDIERDVRASLNAAPVVPPGAATKEEVQAINKRLFFADNPQYKGYEKLIEKMGGNPAEVVAMPEFQETFEKLKVADEVATRKTNVPSNQRLSQVKTVTDEAIARANARGSTNEDVALTLARGINEEMQG